MIGLGTKNMSKLVETGLFNLHEFIKSREEITWIESSPEYDNDYLLKNNIPENCSVISRFPCIDNLEVSIEFHRLSLGIDEHRVCILIPASSDIEGHKEEIKNVRKKYSLGLYGVSEESDIEKLEDKPDYISVEINPLRYPKTVLTYAKKNEIPTIGHGIFGGDIWAGYVRSIFPDGFLFEFARSNVDIVILPTSDFFFLSDISKRFKLPRKQGGLYEYSRDLDKIPALPIPPRKIHGKTEIEVKEGPKIVMTCGNSSDSYSLKKTDIKIDGEILWEDIDLPEDIDKDNLDLLGCYHRYHVSVFLDEQYNPKFWKKQITKIAPDFYAIKIISKFWFIRKEHLFWLVSGNLIKTPLSKPKILNNEY